MSEKARGYAHRVDIGADVNPAGAGIWELPGLGQSKPSIGTRYQPTRDCAPTPIE